MALLSNYTSSHIHHFFHSLISRQKSMIFSVLNARKCVKAKAVWKGTKQLSILNRFHQHQLRLHLLHLSLLNSWTPSFKELLKLLVVVVAILIPLSMRSTHFLWPLTSIIRCTLIVLTSSTPCKKMGIQRYFTQSFMRKLFSRPIFIFHQYRYMLLPWLPHK